MTDYYILFSEVLTGLKPEAIKWMEEWLKSSDSEMSAEEYEQFCEERGLDADTSWPDFNYEFQPGGNMLIYSEDSGSPDNVMEVVKRYFEKFDPKGSFFFRWVMTASRPEPGAFSAGAAFITANDIKVQLLDDWLEEKRNQWERESGMLTDIQKSPSTASP